MGASKRAAEMLLRSLAAQTSSTRFCSVRFGNVIGSRGSVIPIFRKQIASGGPVTLTDERMARYFITAAEASQLVFQACCIADRGEVLALDMGEPLLIKDIARRMVELSGKPVKIYLTGARPGERLTEELWSEADAVHKTEFPRILEISSAPGDPHFAPDFSRGVRELESAARRSEHAAVRELLSRLVQSRAELHTGAHRAD
jgi:FlaA1/EpsC-like NDP-sugar epimerase